MRFYFDAPGHEAGFVWLRTGHEECLEITSGLGSARKFARLELQPSYGRNSPQKAAAEKEVMCRIAITQYLREIGGAIQLAGSLNESLEPWSGKLRPVPPRPM